MTTDSASALIVAKPGPLRDDLRSLIAKMFRIETLEEANDVSSALKANLEHNPTLIFLDSDMEDDEIWIAMGKAKKKWPQARCIIL